MNCFRNVLFFKVTHNEKNSHNSEWNGNAHDDGEAHPNGMVHFIVMRKNQRGEYET